jgi:hypothetical protein
MTQQAILQDEDFDCSGKQDGNYPDPYDCTRFFSCSGGIASLRDCAMCPNDPIRCPAGRMVYNATVNECLSADETKCEEQDDADGGEMDPRGHRVLAALFL